MCEYISMCLGARLTNNRNQRAQFERCWILVNFAIIASFIAISIRSVDCLHIHKSRNLRKWALRFMCYMHTQAADRSVYISVECWSNRSFWLFVAKYHTLRHSSYPHPCPSPCPFSFHFFCCNQLNKHKTRHTRWSGARWGGGRRMYSNK